MLEGNDKNSNENSVFIGNTASISDTTKEKEKRIYKIHVTAVNMKELIL
jgi:hypothetical protein